MLKRIITGLILTPIVIFGVLYLPAWGFFCMVETALMLALYEFLSLSKILDKVSQITGLFIGLIIGFCFMLIPSQLIMVLSCASIFTLIYNLFRPNPIEQAALRTGLMLSSLFYIVFLGSFILLLGNSEPHGREKILIICASIWLGDTGAYFGGKGIGGPKLYQLISPKKTWAGAVTGLMGSVLGGFLIKLLCYPEIEIYHCISVSILTGAFGQIGDLAESLFKRSFQVKDSGTILPGHGGMLDRIDAILFGAPVGYLYFYLLTLV